jgi:hypothetical protein
VVDDTTCLLLLAWQRLVAWPGLLAWQRLPAWPGFLACRRLLAWPPSSPDPNVIPRFS